MNSIFQALESGYGEDEILQFLSKSIPKLGSTIKKAQKSGYLPGQILGFLSKNFDSESRFGKSESEIHALNRNADAQRAKYGLSVLGTAIATPVAANAARSALSRALPQSLQAFGGAPPQTNNPSIPHVENPLNTSSAPTLQLPQGQTTPIVSQQPPVNSGNANNIPQSPNIQQSNLDTRVIKNSIAYRNQINSLINSGNGPEEIEAYLQKFQPSFIKTIEKEGKGPFKHIVAQYIQEKLRDEAMQPEGSMPTKENQLSPQKPMGLDSKSEKLDLPQESPKIEKSSIVASPQGLGQVKEIRNGQALIDVDGKIHNVKEEELTRSPLPEKELADLYEDLIKGIESETEEDVSRMVQWAGYDPESNTLQFLPHDGDLYTYTNIPQEKADLLRNILSVRKTSGSNFIGAWKAGSKSPIGAAMSKLIRELQSERGGKGNEYEAKYPTVYNAYAPAIKARKEKERDEKRKKRERLKNRS